MKNTITIHQAYKAMLIYLDNLYEMTESDDLASFLGSMQLLEDGKPADSAIWSDWLEAVKKVEQNVEVGIELKLTSKK